jgi:diaminopimelate decarboxylase
VNEGDTSEQRGIAVVTDSLTRAAAEFGTPVYVLDAAAMAQAAAQLEHVFPDPWIRQYSLKANDLPGVVSLLAARGWGANVVSGGEWDQARRAGVPDAAVTFEGIGKRDEELERAVVGAARGEAVRWIAVESQAEAQALARIAERVGLGGDGAACLDVLLRLNPGVQPQTLPGLAVGTSSSKFGMGESEILAVLQAGLDTSGLRVRGIHVHTGSDLGSVTAWADAGVRAVRLLGRMSSYVASADTVDFGGGFPHAVGGPTPADFRDALVEALASAGLALPPRHAVEPGRFLVGAAGWLVTRVLHSRPRPPYPQQVVLDAGMTELIRPALYGSRHPVHALGETDVAGDLLQTSVEGPVCESTDTFGLHPMPLLSRGDLVAIGDAGAYAASFTSHYNGRPQPVEIIVWPDGSSQRCERVPPTQGASQSLAPANAGQLDPA